MLDFDFEKLCSVSMGNMNVYACLVCGKYFQGRGKNTHAYAHSLEEDHHVYINLHNEQVYPSQQRHAHRCPLLDQMWMDVCLCFMLDLLFT
jgi:U4/U6.U5 tri-snRNP-associated protein 2